MEEKKNGNGVSQEVVDLVHALKSMNDLEGCSYFLERIEVLSRLIDQAAEDGLPFGRNDAVGFAYWQRKILDEIRHVLDHQDSIISKLKSIVLGDKSHYDLYEGFQADRKKLEALRSLNSLFIHHNLIYEETTDVKDLNAWAKTYDFDFEAVKTLLGGKILKAHKETPEQEATTN